MKNPIEDLLKYYNTTPWVALLRAIEIRLVQNIQGNCEFPMLDLGCGNGLVAKFSFNDKIDAGIDIDRYSLLEAVHHGAYRDVYQADSRSLPFKDSTFHTVYSNCAMEHMNDLDLVIGEIARVLRPGGILITLLPSEKILNPTGKLGTIFGQKFWDIYNEIHNHVNLLPEKHWCNKLNENGLTVKLIQQYGCESVAKYILNWDFISKFHVSARRPFIRLGHEGNCIRPFSFLNQNRHLLRLYHEELECMEEGYWFMICAEKTKRGQDKY